MEFDEFLNLQRGYRLPCKHTTVDHALRQCLRNLRYRHGDGVNTDAAERVTKQSCGEAQANPPQIIEVLYGPVSVDDAVILREKADGMDLSEFVAHVRSENSCKAFELGTALRAPMKGKSNTSMIGKRPAVYAGKVHTISTTPSRAWSKSC